jgi:hypothetical protein
MEFGYWDDNFEVWPFFVENNIRNNTEADIFFNFDRIHTISGPIWLLPSFEERVIEIRDDHKILMNSDGLTLRCPGWSRYHSHFLRSSIQVEHWENQKSVSA